MQKVISMQMFQGLCGCGMLYPLFGWGNKLTLKIELVGARQKHFLQNVANCLSLLRMLGSDRKFSLPHF